MRKAVCDVYQPEIYVSLSVLRWRDNPGTKATEKQEVSIHICNL